MDAVEATADMVETIAFVEITTVVITVNYGFRSTVFI